MIFYLSLRCLCLELESRAGVAEDFLLTWRTMNLPLTVGLTA